MALIDFTLSNARRFYSSMGNPIGWKGLKVSHILLLTQLIGNRPSFLQFRGNRAHNLKSALC